MVGIDGDGEIYLIETKLYKNTDKRKVVAQVLDYGAALWAHYRNPEDFLSELASHITRDLGTTLRQRAQDFFGNTEEEAAQILETVGQNVVDGNYRFVVLMDTLDNRLKDLILFINQNSEFTIYTVLKILFCLLTRIANSQFMQWSWNITNIRNLKLSFPNFLVARSRRRLADHGLVLRFQPTRSSLLPIRGDPNKKRLKSCLSFSIS